MKLIVQRVARATVEVDGYVESRIGSGLVLSLAVGAGDSFDEARRLATQVMKLKLWPEMLDADKLWSSSVIDNGFEVLVVSQQSLHASFPKMAPSYDGAMEEVQAKKVFEAFVAQLRKEYQEEMIVATAFGANIRVESTLDGPAMFDLGSDAVSNVAKHTGSKVAIKKEVDAEAKKTLKAAPGEVQEPYRPDWGAPPVYTGRAAPNTPGSYGGGKKGGGKARWGGPRSLGIASLDESLRLHGQGRGEYEYGQLSSLPDAKMPVGARVKEEFGGDAKRNGPPLGGAFKRPKGTPTVAPICPGSEEAENEEVWDAL